MKVFLLLLANLVQLFSVGIGLTASFVLFHEYFRKHRRPHLAMFGLYFFGLSIGRLSFFIGSYLSGRGYISIGTSMADLYGPISSIASLLLIFGLVGLYVRTARAKMLAYSLCVLCTLMYAVILNPHTSGIVMGMLSPVGSITHFLRSFTLWIIANFVLVGLAGATYLRGHRKGLWDIGADRYLFLGGAIGILNSVFLGVVVQVWAESLSAFVYVILAIQSVIIALGALAKDNDDSNVRANPLLIIGRSFMAKMLAVVSGLYLLLSILIIAITANYFFELTTSMLDERLKCHVESMASEYEYQLEMASEVSDDIASHSGIPAVFRGQSKLDAVTSEASRHIARYQTELATADGKIIHSGLDSEFVGGGIFMSAIFRRALSSDITERGIEWDERVEDWLVRSVSPVYVDGRRIGFVSVTRPFRSIRAESSGFMTEDLTVGGGFLTGTHESVFSVGEEPDGMAVALFESRASTEWGGGTGTDKEFGFYTVRSVMRPSGDIDGIFYVYYNRALIDQLVASLMSTIGLVAYLILFAVLAMLVYAIMLVLEPIKELEQAANSVMRGDFGHRIEETTEDELGKTSRAFNRMLDTIERRTHSLKEKVREQRDFLDHTVQEMRIPINIFGWTLELLRFGDTGEMNDEQMEMLEQMNHTNERVRSLINSMMLVSKMERGDLKLNRKPMSMEDTVDRVAGSFSVRVNEKNQSFLWQRPRKPLPSVMADPERVEEILDNLIGNAVKFTGSGGQVKVSVSLENSSGPQGRKGEYVMVTVEDSGIGIPQDQQGQIFKRFFRSRNVASQEIEGTGLGLFISKNLVEMHGGEIWFHSAENRGSSFSFTIPVAEDAA